MFSAVPNVVVLDSPAAICQRATLRRAALCAALLLGAAVAVRAAPAPARPNVLFIAIDDLRGDLGALGVAHAQTPRLDSFAATARTFSRHYVQVPTCGASRGALLRGRYPSEPAHVGNNAISSTHARWGDVNLPAWLKRHGYRTYALGKITHRPGGRIGAEWAEGPEELPGSWTRCWIPDAPWKTGEAIMHAYAQGGRRTLGRTPPWEAFDGPDDAYPDYWVANDAVTTLRTLASTREPWFFAVGFFKPHLPFAAPKRYYDRHDPAEIPVAVATQEPRRGRHGSGELKNNYSNNGRDPDTDPSYARLLRQAYAASISYVDTQVGRVLDALGTLGLAESTIVIVWSDHGFLLGEHGIWGKHCLYERALRSPLMLRTPGLPNPGEISDAIVETVDVFPTVLDLCNVPAPAGLDGRSLRPQLRNAAAPGEKPALSFWTGGQRTIRTERWRLIAFPGATPDTAPLIELFDFQRDPDELTNRAADEPAIVAELLARLPPPLPPRTTGGKR